MKFREVEVKFDASEISLKDFTYLVESKFKVKKHLLVSSYDEYFIDASDNFLRYRHRDDRGELTIKRKLTEGNNNKRIEVNIPTDGNALEAVSQFASLLGYKHNFSVYKTCKVFWVDNMVVSYYVVYDNEWKEQRRFIEIEADEEIEWSSEQVALNAVEQCEKEFVTLNITPKNRLKKSLFEIFKRE